MWRTVPAPESQNYALHKWYFYNLFSKRIFFIKRFEIFVYDFVCTFKFHHVNFLNDKNELIPLKSLGALVSFPTSLLGFYKNFNRHIKTVSVLFWNYKCTCLPSTYCCKLNICRFLCIRLKKKKKCASLYFFSSRCDELLWFNFNSKKVYLLFFY